MLEKLPLAEISLTDEAIARLIGHRVRLARQLCGLSQQRAAAVMGVTFQQVQKYEKGSNRICPAKLARLARATGRSIGWFYDDVAEPMSGYAADIVQDLANDRDFSELVGAWRRLGLSARRTAMETTRLLAELTIETERGRAA